MHDAFEGRIDVKFSRAVATGVTGNWAFAAGTVLLALRRHNPGMEADIIVFCDDSLLETDAAILRNLGAQLVPFTPVPAELTPEALEVFSPLSLAKFDCFDLLQRYASVVWLDADVLIQDSLEELFDCGPLGLALEGCVTLIRRPLTCWHRCCCGSIRRAFFNYPRGSIRIRVIRRRPLRQWCMPLERTSCGMTASPPPVFLNGSVIMPAGSALAAAPMQEQWKMLSFLRVARFHCSGGFAAPLKKPRPPLPNCSRSWKWKPEFGPDSKLWSAGSGERCNVPGTVSGLRQPFAKWAAQP